MIMRWSSGCDASCNAWTARRASTSAGSASGRKTLLERAGLTISGDGGGAATNTGAEGAESGGGEGAAGGDRGDCGGGREAEAPLRQARDAQSRLGPRLAHNIA